MPNQDTGALYARLVVDPEAAEPVGGDGRSGVSDDVAWINAATSVGLTIAAAIPPTFARYATVVIPDDNANKARSDVQLIGVLSAHAVPQPWWLGYLDTGVADTVVPDAMKVIVYTGWQYVLIEGGPEQALTWRRNTGATPWHSAIPELIFPVDRSWLVSTLWDDDWRCVGGSAALIEALLTSPGLDARSVTVEQDATPPGHQAQ